MEGNIACHYNAYRAKYFFYIFYLSYSLSNDSVSSPDYLASKNRMIRNRYISKYLEVSVA